tara:strand:+ start:260 stop:820 length:561 start_codon:yes stop_codon:yes gene_type:complete
MKKHNWIIATTFLFIIASCSHETRKQNAVGDSEGMNIGFIRLDSLTKLYDYHGVLVKEIEAKAKKMEAELIRSQQNIQTEYEVLQQAAPNLSKIELERAQLDFQRIQQQYQALEQQRSGELQQEEIEMNTFVKSQVDEAIDKMKDDLDLDIVLIYESNLLYAKENMDLTAELAEYLNELEIPENTK